MQKGSGGSPSDLENIVRTLLANVFSILSNRSGCIIFLSLAESEIPIVWA